MFCANVGVRVPPNPPTKEKKNIFPLVAQLVERLFEAQKVIGSIPIWGTDGESPNGMASHFECETM